MPNFICTTCGTQHAESEQPPSVCAVCEDDRQYLKVTGQQWTTHDKLRLTNRNSIRFEEPGLTGIGVEPHFAIGQRALLVRTPKGDVLWDCVPLLDPALVVGQGLAMPALTAAFAGTADAHRRGGVLGVQQSASGLARVVGPLVGGLLFEHIGVASPYVVGAALMALCAVLVTRL